MDVLASAIDPWDRLVVLSKTAWEGHILATRQELSGFENAVMDAVKSPDLVALDADHVNRECFYRNGGLPLRPHLSLKVIVEFDECGAGRIVTAFPIQPRRVKPGERIKWP